jgi:hypothetical protein
MRRGAWARSTSRAPIIPPGSTTRAPSSTSAGARASISPSSSTPRGLMSAPPTIHGRCGIPGDERRYPAGSPVDPFGVLGTVPSRRGNPFYEGWISLDFLVRTETYHRVARDVPRKFFLAPCLGARGRKGLLRSRPLGRAKIVHGVSLLQFLIVSNNLSSETRDSSTLLKNIANCAIAL